jgi:hypothetical protein
VLARGAGLGRPSSAAAAECLSLCLQALVRLANDPMVAVREVRVS